MALLDLGKQPISEQDPAGGDVRFEPDGEALSREIEKLSSPTASGGVDWKKVVDLSTKILSEQSKDLLVACYLSMGLFHTEQAAGLAQGIHVVRDLLENFWETLHPPQKRMRGRRNALEWWQEKTLEALQSIGPQGTSQEAISALGEDLDGIDRFLAENMEDAPGLRRLIDIAAALKTAAAEATEEKPETDSQKALEPEPPAAGPASTESPAGIQTEAEIQQALRGGLGKLREVAAFYMGQNLFHPLVYRLNRIAAWTPVEGLPPSTDGKTRIPPPPQQIVTAIETLYQGGDWQGLLKTAESRVGEFLFWLDLSRFAAESMDHLGHENLRDLIAGEASLFVSRLKGLEALCFSDGKPFADTETKAWLKRFTSSGGTQEALAFSAVSGASTDEVQAKIAEEYTKARGLVKKKKIGDAVSLLHRQLCDGSSGKEKLLWRIALSQLLVSAKEERTAVPHLMDVLQDVDRYHLEQWEPDLALQAMMGIYTGFRSQKGEEFKPKAAEILDRIAGLNPAQALQLK